MKRRVVKKNDSTENSSSWEGGMIILMNKASELRIELRYLGMIRRVLPLRR